MKILILAAMQKELNLLIDLLANATLIEESGYSVYHGQIGVHDVWISKCGIGKVNAATNTVNLIYKIQPELLINSGVAGGAGIPIGSLLVADKVAYWDVWCGPGTIPGQADGLPLYLTPDTKICNIASNLIDNVQSGLICSGDKFISSADEIKFIRSIFPDVKAVDMESAAIAHVCWMVKLPFAIIRVVSDTPGEGENIDQYKNFWMDAPVKTFEALRIILENL